MLFSLTATELFALFAVAIAIGFLIGCGLLQVISDVAAEADDTPEDDPGDIQQLYGKSRE